MQTKAEQSAYMVRYRKIYRAKYKKELSATDKEYYAKNKERIKARAKNYYAENRENCKATEKRRKYLTRYGLTLEQYRQMVMRQEGNCALCFTPPKPGKNLHTDHEHRRKAHPEDTGRVRGALCFYCNVYRVGRLRAKDAPILRRMADYLESTYDARKLDLRKL
jgi:recombination endonuclease VII